MPIRNPNTGSWKKFLDKLVKKYPLFMGSFCTLPFLCRSAKKRIVRFFCATAVTVGAVVAGNVKKNTWQSEFFHSSTWKKSHCIFSRKALVLSAASFYFDSQSICIPCIFILIIKVFVHGVDLLWLSNY